MEFRLETKAGNDTLIGGIKVTETVWESADRPYIYVVAGADLIIGQRTSAGSATVTDTLTVKNWHAGGLGLSPQTAAAPAPAPQSHLTVYQAYSPAANDQGSVTEVIDGQSTSVPSGGDYTVACITTTGQASIVGNGPDSQFITADSWDQQISTGGGNDPLQVRSNSPDSIANNGHSTLGSGLFGCKSRKLTACAALSKLWLERPGETRLSFTEKCTRSFP